MVQVFHLTGIASARTTAISLGAWLGRERIATITALRLITRRSYALATHSHAFSGHALAAHSHTFTGNALAAHSHNVPIRASNVAFSTVRALVGSAGNVVTSGAHGAFPLTSAITGGTPTATLGPRSAGTPTAGLGPRSGGNILGISVAAYTIDSNGRYVAAATHPAAGHAVLKPHGAAGPRIELGDALRATDLMEIAALMLRNSGGVF